MARFCWHDPAIGGGAYWTDGWDGYAPARKRLLSHRRRQEGAGRRRPRRRRPHQLRRRPQGRLRRPTAPVVASEFCGTSISSLSLAQSRIDAARELQPAHPLRPRRPARLRELRARREAAAARAAGRRPAARSAERRDDGGALRRRRRATGCARGLTAAPDQNRPAFPAASSTTRESSAICALTSLDGDVVAFAVQTSRPLGTSVTRPFAE